MAKNEVHAEIQYINKEGYMVHSDICPPDCDPDNLANKEYRKFLHACLDEWLDNSKGTWYFYIKGAKYNLNDTINEECSDEK